MPGTLLRCAVLVPLGAAPILVAASTCLVLQTVARYVAPLLEARFLFLCFGAALILVAVPTCLLLQLVARYVAPLLGARFLFRCFGAAPILTLPVWNLPPLPRRSHESELLLAGIALAMCGSYCRFWCSAAKSAVLVPLRRRGAHRDAQQRRPENTGASQHRGSWRWRRTSVLLAPPTALR